MAYFPFFLSFSFGIETINTFIDSRISLANHNPIPDQNGKNLYLFSNQNGAKTLPDWAVHTYIAYIREYPSGALEAAEYGGYGAKRTKSITDKQRHIVYNNRL